MAMQARVSRNYNSEGYGLSLTVELDQELLDRPPVLPARVAQLYGQLDAALEAQTGESSGDSTSPAGPAKDNHGHGHHSRGRHATGYLSSTSTRCLRA